MPPIECNGTPVRSNPRRGVGVAGLGPSFPCITLPNRPRPVGAVRIAPGMSAELEVKVLHGTFLEVTMSRRQLHEAERRVEGRRQRRSSAVTREAVSTRTSARSCGMEGLGEPQHRAQAKLRKAAGVWASVPSNATPDVQTRPRGSGDGGGGTLCVLTRRDLHESARCGRREGGNDDPPMPRCAWEKSDRPTVVMKPGNSGGAKGATG